MKWKRKYSPFIRVYKYSDSRHFTPSCTHNRRWIVCWNVLRINRCYSSRLIGNVLLKFGKKTVENQRQIINNTETFFIERLFLWENLKHNNTTWKYTERNGRHVTFVRLPRKRTLNKIKPYEKRCYIVFLGRLEIVM